MTQAQFNIWTAHMADAALALDMAEAFKSDRAARRHWLDLAALDMTKAHAIRQAARWQAAEDGPLLLAA